MSNPWEITGKRILAISDVHQRTDWMNAVFSHENGNYDHIVFLGDMMDSYDEPPVVSSARRSANEYANLLSRQDVTVLVGNHDLPYIECFKKSKAFKKNSNIINSCPGFSNSKSIDFAKELTAELLQNVNLFCVANGYLLSHAGFREHFWNSYWTNEQNLAYLWHKSKEDLRLIDFIPSVLFAIGEARGGNERMGGPVWCDWDYEFQDNLPIPQIVGHTNCHNTYRQIGKSFCIDSGGIGYAIIMPDGQVLHKGLALENDRWIPKELDFRDDTEYSTSHL